MSIPCLSEPGKIITKIDSILDVSKYISGLTAIVFDLDDTLYSEKSYVRSGYKCVASILPQIENAEQKLWKAFEEKKSAIDEVLLSEGIYTEERKQQCLEAYRSHQPSIRLYEGVLPMLRELRQQGYLLGILTDGRPQGQQAKIKALGLEPYVDSIIITDTLGGTQYRKPHEKAFMLMKERLGVAAYPEMCYVGDNPSKDFTAPEKLGIRPIWFRNPDGLYSCCT